MTENAEVSSEAELNYLRSELETHKQKIEQLETFLFPVDELQKALPVVKALEFRTQKFDDPNYMQSLLQKAVLQTPLYRWSRSFIVGFVLLGVIVWTGGTVYSGIQIGLLQDQARKVSQQSENFLGTVNDRVREITEDTLNSTQRFAQETADLKRVAEKHVATIEASLSAAQSDAEKIATAREDLSEAITFQKSDNGHTFAFAPTSDTALRGNAGDSNAAVQASAPYDQITLQNLRGRLDQTTFYLLCGLVSLVGFSGLVSLLQVVRRLFRWFVPKPLEVQTARRIAHQRLNDPEFRPEPTR